MSHPMLPETYRLESYRRETEDTFTVDLVPEERFPAFHFAPGQFNMLYAFGGGEVPISISGDPERTECCTHTIRAVGPVTRLLKDLNAGSHVGLRGPFGRPWPLDQARGKDLLIIGGGIGLAPLRPVIYRALAQREAYRRVAILYGARTPKEVLYPEELELWGERPDTQVEVTVDSADTTWVGHVGVVPRLISEAEFDPMRTLAMVCGPEIMMRFTVSELQKTGMSDDRIFLSMERNMRCGIGLCGHCQYGADFVCKDGPVFSFDRVRTRFLRKEL